MRSTGKDNDPACHYTIILTRPRKRIVSLALGPDANNRIPHLCISLRHYSTHDDIMSIMSDTSHTLGYHVILKVNRAVTHTDLQRIIEHGLSVTEGISDSKVTVITQSHHVFKDETSHPIL